MEYEHIYEREYDSCNKFVAKAGIFLMLFASFIWLLNILNIFVINQKTMNMVMIIAIPMFLSSSALYYIFKKIKINTQSLALAYISSTLYSLAIGWLYTFLTYHTILLFLLPAVLFNIYGNKKLTYYVMCSTIVVMFFAHFASFYCQAIGDEPLTTMRTILLFGFVPKMLIYIATMYVFIFQTKHNRHMINRVFRYARDMHQTQEELVKSFAEISESKSGQTGQHVKRVSLYVNIMARELKIDGQELESLTTAAMMHDVGKLMIPTEIIDKPGKLTDEEFAVIKKHTQFGYDLLKNSPGRTMEIAAQIALQHHERYDGRGYAGIKGEAIDYYSRIMSICDVFDALVSKRSYKSKWEPKDAFDEICAQGGKQFDPQLVVIFKNCYPQFLEVMKNLPDD